MAPSSASVAMDATSLVTMTDAQLATNNGTTTSPISAYTPLKECMLLVKLPAELRNNIYRHVLVKHCTHIHDFSSEYERSPAVLRTCRQIQDEATPIFFSETRFCLNLILDHQKSYLTFAECESRVYRVKTPAWIKRAKPEHARLRNISVWVNDRITEIRWGLKLHSKMPTSKLLLVWSELEAPGIVDLDRIVGGMDEWYEKIKDRAHALQHEAGAKGTNQPGAGLSFEEVVRVVGCMLPSAHGQIWPE